MAETAIGIGKLGSNRGKGFDFSSWDDWYARRLVAGDVSSVERGLASLGSYGKNFDLAVDFGGQLGVQHFYVYIPPALPGHAVVELGDWKDPKSFFCFVDVSLQEGYPGGKWTDSPLEDAEVVGMARYELAGLLAVVDPARWVALAGGPRPELPRGLFGLR